MLEDDQIASSSEWAIKNVVLDVGEPMDALCTNKRFDLLTVAGRSVMKIFALKENEFDQILDLKSKTRRMNLYFSGSISWNPVNENLIAATSSTGLIVLFDIENCRNSNQDSIRFMDPEGASGSDQFFKANKAAATKVCFHSYNPKLLISGSRDTTIYLHDLRHAHPAASYSVNGISIDSIRDMQFCLDSGHQDYFVTGGDSGIVRFWDLRKPDRYLKEFIGNTSSVGIALNPDVEQWNLLATVGRDGFIRIWDWSVEKPKPLHTIETPTNIGRVEWCNSRIATTTNMHDNQLLIWDYNRPFFPIKTFRGHDTNISDMAFPRQSDEGKFVTCGKDRKLILHFMEYGDDTMENTVPISMDCGPYNEIITSFPKNYTQNEMLAEFDYSKPVKPLILQYSDDVLPSFNDSDNLIRLAKLYKVTGDNPVRICNWNAHVNRQLGNLSLSYTWKMIGILIQQAEIYKPTSSHSLDDTYFEYIDSNKRRKKRNESDENEDLTDSEPELNVESGAFQNSQEAALLESDLFYNLEEFNMASLPGGGRCLEIWQQKQRNLIKADLTLVNEEAMFNNSDSTDSESDNGSDLDGSSNGSNQRLSSEEDKTPSERSASPILSSSYKSPLMENESVGSVNSDIDNSMDDEKIENYFSASLNNTSENWGPLSILKRLINAYSDIGDSQTCATISLILGKLANQMFGETQISAWFFHYIDMLQDVGCNELATYMAKMCDCEEVKKVIEENMHVKFFCANCSTAAPSGVTSCPKCNIAFATVCTVCDYEVKGLFSQCNECGHGGHFEHLHEWFTTFGVCAFPGCLHVCVEADKIKDPIIQNRTLLPYGQNVFTDTDDLGYYRDENGVMQRLPDILIESTSKTSQKGNKYSLNP